MYFEQRGLQMICELPTGEAAISSPYFNTHRLINITSEGFLFVTSHFCRFLLSDHVKKLERFKNLFWAGPERVPCS